MYTNFRQFRKQPLYYGDIVDEHLFSLKASHSEKVCYLLRINRLLDFPVEDHDRTATRRYCQAYAQVVHCGKNRNISRLRLRPMIDPPIQDNSRKKVSARFDVPSKSAEVVRFSYTLTFSCYRDPRGESVCKANSCPVAFSYIVKMHGALVIQRLALSLVLRGWRSFLCDAGSYDTVACRRGLLGLVVAQVPGEARCVPHMGKTRWPSFRMTGVSPVGLDDRRIADSGSAGGRDARAQGSRITCTAR